MRELKNKLTLECHQCHKLDDAHLALTFGRRPMRNSHMHKSEVSTKTLINISLANYVL